MLVMQMKHFGTLDKYFNIRDPSCVPVLELQRQEDSRQVVPQHWLAVNTIRVGEAASGWKRVEGGEDWAWEWMGMAAASVAES